MKKLLALIIAAGPAVGVFAGEQDKFPNFKQLDVDQDGKISVTEATADQEFASLFDKLDTDRDGGISVEEYENLIKSQTM